MEDLLHGTTYDFNEIGVTMGKGMNQKVKKKLMEKDAHRRNFIH